MNRRKFVGTLGAVAGAGLIYPQCGGVGRHLRYRWSLSFMGA